MHVERLSLRHDRYVVKNILRFGVPNGLESGMFQLGKILLLSTVSVLGTASVAANAIGNTVTTFQCVPGQRPGPCHGDGGVPLHGRGQLHPGPLLYEKAAGQDLSLHGGHHRFGAGAAAADPPAVQRFSGGHGLCTHRHLDARCGGRGAVARGVHAASGPACGWRHPVHSAGVQRVHVDHTGGLRHFAGPLLGLWRGGHLDGHVHRLAGAGAVFRAPVPGPQMGVHGPAD